MAWKGLVFVGLILNAAGLFPLVLLNQAPCIGWQLPDSGAWRDVFLLNPRFYLNARKYFEAALIGQLLFVLVLRRGCGGLRPAARLVAHVFRPFLYGGILGLVSLFPLYPLTCLSSFLWFAVLLVWGWRLIGAVRDRLPDWRIPWLSARRAGWTVFGVSLLLYLYVWALVAWPVVKGYRDYLLTGDQPGYLHVAESIVRDHDLNLQNNRLPPGTFHDMKDVNGSGVERFNPGLARNDPLFIRLAQRFGNGAWSLHRCGTSVLIAPFYGLGSWLGGWERRLVTLFLIVVMAAAMREIVLTAFALGVSPTAGLLMGVGVAACAPAVCMSTAIYPEVFVVLAIGRMLRLIVSGEKGWRADFESGVWLAMAPWLQDKYGVWLLPLFVARALMASSYRRSWPAMALAPLVSAFLMAHQNLFLYGRLLPRNGLGQFVSVKEAVWGGLSGTWFDCGYGLAVLAPFVFLTVAGLVCWRRNVADAADWRPSLGFWAVIVSLLTGWFIIGTWDCWHGGFAPPTRFMLTLLPYCAVSAMIATTRLGPPAQNLAVVLWILSLAMGIECLVYPDLWYSRLHPAAEIVRLLGLRSYSVGFPVYMSGNLGQTVLCVAATTAGIVIFGYFGGAAWRGPGTRERWIKPFAFGTLICCAMAGGLSSGSLSIEAGDIPMSIGIFRKPLVQVGQDGKTKLECDLEFFRGARSRPWGIGIHNLDAKGRILSQEDFDLRTYLDKFIYADATRLELYERCNRIHIERILHPPQGTTHIRVALYNPATGEPFRNIWRENKHIIPYKPSPSRAGAD